MTDHMTDRSPGFTRAAGGLSRADGVRRLTRQPIGIQSSPGPRTSPGLPSPGLRSVVQTTVVALVALAAVLPADTASAWCWRPRAYAYGYGWGWRPWCGPRVVATYGCSSYSYSYSYGSSCYGWGGWGWPGYGACGPVFYSGCAYPSVVYGWYPGGLSVGWGFSGYGCGPLGSYGWGPFAAAAPAATTRGLDVAAVAAAPVTRTRPAVRPVSLAANEPQRARAASIGRPAASSTAARMRAGKLVASGRSPRHPSPSGDRPYGHGPRGGRPIRHGPCGRHRCAAHRRGTRSRWGRGTSGAGPRPAPRSGLR
jgi:hypothetical protein